MKFVVSKNRFWSMLFVWLWIGVSPSNAQTLPNGLRFTLKERHTLPLVALCLLVDAGSRSELPGEEGAAHLLEHWLFKGAGTRKRGDIDREIETLGGTLSAVTMPDAMRLTVTLPAAHWRDALPIFADIAFRATLPPEEFRREKRVVLDELALRTGDPLETQIADLYAKIYPNHPYARVPGGTPQTISRLSPETVRAFYRRNYLPERCVFSLAGDFTTEDAENAIRKAFGTGVYLTQRRKDAKTLSHLSKIDSSVTEKRTPSLLTCCGVGDGALASLRLCVRSTNAQRPTPNAISAFPLPPASNRRLTATVNLIAELLGDERGGRFGKVNGGGAVPVQITTRFTSRKENALFFVQGESLKPASELLEDFPKRIRDAIFSLKTRPPILLEMALARKSLAERLKRDRETVAEVAQTNGFALLTGGDMPDTLEARAATITPKEISAFVEAYWQDSEQKSAFVEPVFSSRIAKSVTPVSATEKSAVTTLQTLTNGTRLLMTPLPDAAGCTVTAFVRTEPDRDDEQNAIGLLVSRAIFFGSLNQPFETVAFNVHRTGDNLQFLRGRESVTFTLQTRSDKIRDAAYLLSDCLKNAQFSAESLERARQQIARERAETHRQLRSYAEAELGERLFGKDPEDAALRRVTPEKAIAYFKNHYLAERTVISVAGAFSPKIVLRLFDNDLFDFERRSVKPLQKTEPLPLTPLTVQDSQTFPTPGAHLFLATPAPALTSDDYPAFLVLAAILGKGNGSRLFSEIRDAKGEGYEIGASLLLPQWDALLIGLGWDANRTDFTAKDALAEVEAQCVRLTQSPPTPEELHRAVALLVGTETSRRENPRECAVLMALYEGMGRGFAFAESLQKSLQSVTSQDVLRVARYYLTTRYALLLNASTPQKL